jgi:hypothetical protein
VAVDRDGALPASPVRNRKRLTSAVTTAALQAVRPQSRRRPIQAHVGELTSVRGHVGQLSFSRKGHAFLNFDGYYPRQAFTGFIRVDDVDHVGGEASCLPLLVDASRTYFSPVPRH